MPFNEIQIGAVIWIRINKLNNNYNLAIDNNIKYNKKFAFFAWISMSNVFIQNINRCDRKRKHNNIAWDFFFLFRRFWSCLLSRLCCNLEMDSLIFFLHIPQIQCMCVCVCGTTNSIWSDNRMVLLSIRDSSVKPLLSVWRRFDWFSLIAPWTWERAKVWTIRR